MYEVTRIMRYGVTLAQDTRCQCLLQRRPKWHLTVLAPSSGLWAQNPVPELVPPISFWIKQKMLIESDAPAGIQTSPFPALNLPFCHPGIHSPVRQLLATENHPLPAYSPLLSQCVDRSPMGRRIISWLCTGHTKAWKISCFSGPSRERSFCSTGQSRHHKFTAFRLSAKLQVRFTLKGWDLLPVYKTTSLSPAAQYQETSRSQLKRWSHIWVQQSWIQQHIRSWFRFGWKQDTHIKTVKTMITKLSKSMVQFRTSQS